jgi:Carboxypeptidase regulatory-like domain/TonB-dependent Receptor Plug Domain
MLPARLAALAVAVAFAASAGAQTSASLTGTVTAAERSLAGVRVTVSSPALQGTRSAVTGDSGAYEFASLPPGEYVAEFMYAGFVAPKIRSVLRLSQTTRIDVEMRPTASDTITITAATAPALETPQVSTNLTLQQIERLPVLRNQLDTARFAPGVNGNTLSNGQLYISGGPGYDNLVLVNGVVVTENTRGQMRPMYVEDAIQETTLLTGAISAEYGRFSGGVVSTITKSGGNELSASLRDSLSSPSWSAQTPAAEAREPTLNHVWEGTLGGFVARDRLWFFTAGRLAANDTARQTVAMPGADAISYAEGNDQKRWEGKLTGQLGARQSLVASFFSIRTKGTNVRFNNNIYDLASLTTRNDPESLVAVHYDGMVVPNVVTEGHYAARKFADRSGAFATDIVNGTLLLDRSNNNTRFNAPTLCGVCDVEHRNNDDVLLETRAFLDAGRLGSHELVAGVDRFSERRYANNHQSGSDFSLFVTRVQAKDGVLYPVITPTNASGGGSFIRWNPIFAPAAEDDLRTDSVFVNDVWSFGTHWRLSAGARWDRNHAVDADGIVSADDRLLSPRLSAQFDIRGDGRHRISASFGEYASRIADSIASSNQAAGNAASIDFAYTGPAINNNALTVPLPDAIQMVFDWFNSKQDGTANLASGNLRPNGTRTVPGFATYFDGTLRSPFVREITLGFGEQLSANGYVRADLVHRDWHDFYAASVTPETRRATTPLGIPVDLVLMRNSNNVRRQYRAVQLQARWTPPRVDAGVFYTWSKLRGNDEGESATGANANVDPSMYYPEFFACERANPIGYLTGDQRHKTRAWAGYTLPVGRGSVSATLLQSYDSGLAYSIAGPINLTRYSGAPKNPGYNSIPNGIYYFSDRGALRTEGVRSTDLALRGALRVARVEYFVQADVLNALNNDAIADPAKLGTTVSTAATSSALQPFDPAKQTPIEGVHYQLAPNFGQPLNNLAYQTPRTFRMSLGARF